MTEDAFSEAMRHRAAGRLVEAEQAYLRILETEPESITAHYELAGLLKDQGKLDAAATHYRRVLAVKPDLPDAHRGLGDTLRRQRQFTKAIASLCTAIALDRSFDNVHSLASAFLEQGMVGDALTLCEEAVRLRPESDQAQTTLGDALYNLGRWKDSVKAYERAVAINPHSARAHSNLLFVLTRTQIIPPQEILTRARRFEAEVCTPPAVAFKARPISTGKKLGIGVLSAELGQHPVAYFLESYLRHSDRERFEVTLYSTVTWRDPKHAELLALADTTRDLSGQSDDAARTQIMADALDILVETTGHTSHGRLKMLAQRCAPVQCQYIGYFGTSGVTAMDYFIGDGEVTPPHFAPHFSETLYRLPSLWMVYAPPVDAPVPRQESREDEIVLGSFNSLAKIGDEMLDLWGKLLVALPTARLVLKDRLCADAQSCERIAAHLAADGVARDRITFLQGVPTWREHMALYNRIDIALDAFPFNSATTAFDALFMGTPLVAMRGACMSGRMSSAIVKALGHADWVATTADEYMEIVRRLTADKSVLKNTKNTLRADVLRSPLCDGASLARALEDAFLAMAEAHNKELRLT